MQVLRQVTNGVAAATLNRYIASLKSAYDLGNIDRVR